MSSRWRTVKGVMVWTVATGLGMGVSWFGVRPVIDAAVPDRPAAFPVTEPHSEPAVTVTPRAGVPPSGSGAPAPPASRRPPSPSAPASVSASAPPPPVTIDGWLSVGDGTFLRSFRLSGGDATVRAGPGTVDLISATPRAGWIMTVRPTDDDRVVVNFTALLRHATLDVTWDDGDTPAVEVTELP